MKTITTKSGRTLYIVATIPQVDGGVRYACAATYPEAIEARDIIRDNPPMIDYLDLIPVDA